MKQWASRCTRHRANVGFSLLELLISVAIISIVMAIAVPAFVTQSQDKLDQAASEVSSALRYARSEAMRTGTSHGVRLNTSDSRVRVFELPSAATETYTVYHPFDKQLYNVDLYNFPFNEGVNVTVSDFRFGGSATQHQAVAFNATGTPVSPVDLSVMDSGSVTLGHDSASVSVIVDAVTGRVYVQ